MKYYTHYVFIAARNNNRQKNQSVETNRDLNLRSQTET